MALDTKRPKGYRKAWNGGEPPATPENAVGICTNCGGYVLRGQSACVPPCANPAVFLMPEETTNG